MSDETTQSSAKTTRKRGLLLLGAAVVIAGVVWGGYTLFFAPASEETDDAYVAGDIVQVTAREQGTVIALHADNTQSVKAGEPLVDFDPALVGAQMAAAEADLAKAVRGVRGGFTQVDEADAEIARAQAALATAKSDLARRQEAVKQGAVSGEEAAHAADAIRTAQAGLALAQSHKANALSAVQGADVAHNPQVLAAIAQVRRMAIAQGHLRLSAPVDGVVAQRSVQLGQQVGPGTPLMAVVPLNKVWVDANFRETQLADIRVGQPVTLHSDAYGKKVTFHGKVIGLSAGSGSAFALLPAQNASGNWIKIVQRLPVRIGLDPNELARTPLRIGLSVTVDVDTRDTSGTPVAAAVANKLSVQQTDQANPEVEARIHQIIAANGGAAK
ncbi:efflux RND transporter periplasmic adaptor subunit [Novosphingobium rosa]|uniref:efflux RND transporter periplasmic adaptor subunit n=1 Tax=Novosphingobium rosa TaxID=76978 RepID=UPI00082D7A13|nr:efflux RND transporter periplasmic adaptor subunit [Novosphingobium rosa]